MVMVALFGCPSSQFLPSCIPVTLFLLAWAPTLSAIATLCLVQDGLYTDTITTMPSQEQKQKQFHNSPPMNEDEDAITTTTIITTL